MSVLVISSIAAWCVIVVLCVLSFSMLAELGRLKLQVAQAGERTHPKLPPIEDDGPAMGSSLPAPDAVALISPELAGALAAWEGRSIMLVFLSALCESCGRLAGPIDELVEVDDGPAVAVIMQGSERAARAFKAAFQFEKSVIEDSTFRVGLELFGVRRSPFGLLYDERGLLVRKGLLSSGADSIAALLGSPGASKPARELVINYELSHSGGKEG